MNRIIVIFLFIGCFFSQIGGETIGLLSELRSAVSENAEGTVPSSEKSEKVEFEAIQTKHQVRFCHIIESASVRASNLRTFLNSPFSLDRKVLIPLYLLYRSILI